MSRDASDEEHEQQLLTQMASKLGGVQPLLEAVFGFLHKRTDFYIEFDPEISPKATMGFPKGAAQRLVQQAFLKFPFKPYEEESSSLAAAPTPITSSSASCSGSGPKSCAPSLQLTAEGKQVPIGNGGIGPNYYWTQTLNDATVYLDVAPGTRGKDVNCDLKARELRLSVSGVVVLSGSFEDPIRQDESMWTINIASESAPQIVFTLEKTKKTWWKSVIVGHPEIDTNKVDSSQRVSDYDEQTQAAIRKIMAEQHDKRMGAKEEGGGSIDVVGNVLSKKA